MQNIGSLLFTIFGIIIFIWLLPTLLWILAIVVLLVVIFVFYQKYKMAKYLKDVNEQMNEQMNQQDTYYSNTNTSSVDDVIDVEFSEREEE